MEGQSEVCRGAKPGPGAASGAGREGESRCVPGTDGADGRGKGRGSGRSLRGAVRWEGTQRCRPAVGAPAVASWVTAVPPESPEPQLCPGPGDLRNIQSPTKARGTGEGVSLRHIPRLRARFHGNQSLLLAPSLPPGMAVGAVGHGTLWQGTSLRSPRAAQRQGQGLGATASAPGNTGKSSCAVGVLMCVSTWGAPLCLCVLSHVHVCECVCAGGGCALPRCWLCAGSSDCSNTRELPIPGVPPLVPPNPGHFSPALWLPAPGGATALCQC